MQELKTRTKYSLSIYGAMGDVSLIEGTVVGISEGVHLPYTANAPENHVNIYPVLPLDVRRYTKDDYQTYQYYHIVTDAGTSYHVGFPWINYATVQEIQTSKLVIEIDNFEGSDYTEVIKAMEKLSLNVSNIYRETER